MRDGALRCLGGGPGHADGAMEDGTCGGGLGAGHGRVHRYAVVGPETWGHGCEACGGKGWEAGTPRVGQW